MELLESQVVNALDNCTDVTNEPYCGINQQDNCKMTTVDYDDSIEIISYRAETDSNAEREFVSFSSFRTDRRGRKPNHPGKARPNRAASITCNLTTPQAPLTERARDLRPCPGVHHSGNDPFMSPQYKRMKCAIIVMAVMMLTACVVLVGISLSMADHIDELVVLLHSSTCRSDGDITDNAEDTAAQADNIPSVDLPAERADGPQAEQEVDRDSLLPTQASEAESSDDIVKEDEKQEKKGDGEEEGKKEEDPNKDGSEVTNIKNENEGNKGNSNSTTNSEPTNVDNTDANNESDENKSEESNEKDKENKEETTENSENTVTEKTAIVEEDILESAHVQPLGSSDLDAEVTTEENKPEEETTVAEVEEEMLESAHVQPLGSSDLDAELTTEENKPEEETTVAEVEEEMLESAHVPLQGEAAGDLNIEATTEENVEVTQEENIDSDKEVISDNAAVEGAADVVTEAVAQAEPEITTVAEPESDLESGKTGEAGDDGVVGNDVTEQMNILETEEPQVEEPTTSSPDGAVDPVVENVGAIDTVTVSDDTEQSTEMAGSEGELAAGDNERTAENTEDAVTTEMPEVEVTTEEMGSQTTASIDEAMVGLEDENKEETVTTVEDIPNEITTESIAEETTENIEITTETLTESVTETITEKEAEIETSTELALKENGITSESSDITPPIIADVDQGDIVTGEPVQSHPDTTTEEIKNIKEEKTEKVIVDHDVTTVESEVTKEEKEEIEKAQEAPKTEVQPKISVNSATVNFGQKLTPEQMRKFKKELLKKMNAKHKENSNKKQIKESLRRRRDADDDTLEDDDEPYTDDNLILDQDENGNVFVRTTDGAPVMEDFDQFILENKEDLQQAAGVPILSVQSGLAASSTNAEDPPVASVWDIHYGLFITIIVLGAISLLIITIYCIRCSRRRGSYDKTPMAVEDGRFQARQPVVMTSPFTDEEMVKGETLTKSTTPNLYSASPGSNGSSKNGHHPSMKEKVDPSIINNGGGQHLSKMEEEYEFGVVPWDQLSGSERNLPDVEYTRF